MPSIDSVCYKQVNLKTMLLYTRPLEINNDIVYEHRGMAFLDSGREIGYVIVLKYYSISSNGWTDWKRAAFFERTGKCLCDEVRYEESSINGRKYQYCFKEEKMGETYYIE